jgi:hypothetical protein
MKLTLRDLFWLALLIATIAGGVTAHRRQIATMSQWNIPFSALIPPGPAVVTERQKSLRRLRQISDEELIKQGQGSRLDDEWLSEVARRKLAQPLEEILSERRKKNSSSGYRLEHLIALRRAQSQPDPLEVRITVDDSKQVPFVVANFKNVDGDGETIGLWVDEVSTSGDRLEHWQIQLVDDSGRQVPISRTRVFFGRRNGRGLGLHPGDEHGPTALELRRYMTPPRTGTYWLQAIYHNELNLAGRGDIEGLVCSRSAPVRVHIHNPDDDFDGRKYIPLAVAGAVALLGIGTIVAVRRRTARFSWRDLAWTCTIVAVALCWQAEQLYLAGAMRRLRPDEQASWTIVESPDQGELQRSSK